MRGSCLRWLLSAALIVLIVTGCSEPRPNGPYWGTSAEREANRSTIIPSAPLQWRTGQTGHADFIALGLSGGGVKSSTFSSEAMFYLDALGLLPKVSMISSVSGGSFAAARYALSCDGGDRDPGACMTPDGTRPRPVWDYQTTMPLMTASLLPLALKVGPGVALGMVMPFVKPTVSASTFASFINGHYLQPSANTNFDYYFRDLDDLGRGKRPRLVLNSTLSSDFRQLTEQTHDKGYLRRRNGDEFFHFAYTDYFFNNIGSRHGDMSLAFAAASSGAFPVLIDYFNLVDYRTCAQSDPAAEQKCWNDSRMRLALVDGGANDNQGVLELYATIGELALGQARSDLSAQPIVRRTPSAPMPDDRKNGLQRMQPGDRALIFVINSSLTEATGLRDAVDHGYWLLGNVNRSLAAVDVYSATSANLRLRLYKQNLDVTNELMRASGWKNRPLNAMDISLLMLDRYPVGGPEAAGVLLAGIRLPPAGPRGCLTPGFDTIACELAASGRIQGRAYAHINQKPMREALRLSNMHPQCLFEQSKLSDGLIGMPENVSFCLRHAARWSTALRAQELCLRPSMGMEPALNGMATLGCEQGNLKRLAHATTANTDITRQIGRCRFGPDADSNRSGNTDEQNRNILRDLRNNALFAGELIKRRAGLRIEDRDLTDLHGLELSRKLENICDLDKMASLSH